MADYVKFDARVDALVMESRTEWDASVGKLPPEDQAWLAKMVHANAAHAKNVSYERSHTGFARIIKVTADDVARIYQARLASK